MIKINLFSTKPVSVNNAYYMRNKQYNQKARDYRDQFFQSLLLDSNQREMEVIRNSFDRNKHFLSFSFQFLIPKDQLFTKKGYMSRKSMDIDNLLKLPCDFICNSKYWDNQDYPCSNLGIDDQMIGTIIASKKESPDSHYYIYVSIEIKNLKDLSL